MQSNNMLSKPSLFKNYIEELGNQSIHPPGKDVVIQACYKAFLELLSKPIILKQTQDIISSREFTPSHFANIFFRAIQYIELNHIKDSSYPVGFENIEKWKEELTKIFSTEFNLLKNLLVTKDTTTTIYQRYAGSKIILNSLFPDKKLRIVDLGCGGNYGLPGLMNNIEFNEITDNTSKKMATSFLNKSTNIVDGLAIDKEDPYDSDSEAWRLACSFYPHELSNGLSLLPKVKRNGVKFARFDLTKVKLELINNDIQPKHFDAVILSTILYQLTSQQIKVVLNFAKKIINENGVIIIQDFARKNKDDKIEFINDWFSVDHPYRTFILGQKTSWKMKEILRWDSGRCREVVEGSDFGFIFNQ